MTDGNRPQATGLRALLNIDESPFPGMSVTFRVMRLGAVWRTRLERELKPTGMTVAGFRPMVYLMMMQEGTSQRELAAALDTDTSALVRVLDLLEAAGLVERRPDSVDRRANNLFITDAGRRKCRAFHEIGARVEAELTEGLSAGEIVELVARLEHVLANAARPSAADMPAGGEAA